jgi:hypothetical protein
MNPIYWPGTKILKSYHNAFNVTLCPGTLAAMARAAQQKSDAGLKGAHAQQARKK